MQLSPQRSEMLYDNTISKNIVMTEYAPHIEWQLKNWLIDLNDSSTFSRLKMQGYGYLMEIQLSGSRLGENFTYLTNLELKQGETDNRVTQPMDLQKRVVISTTLYSLQSRSIIYRNITTTKKNPFGIHDKQGGVYLLNSGSEQRLYHSAIKSALKKMSKDFKLEE